MEIKTIQAAKQYQDIVQKITVFKTPKKFVFQQKITPSPFTCISYNHFDIPDFKVNNATVQTKSKIQITGPKTNDDIYALHNGKLFQVLIELQPTYFYYLFNKSPQSFENKITPIDQLVNPIKVNKLTYSLSENNYYLSHIRKLCQFLFELNNPAHLRIEYIENAIDIIENKNGNVTVNLICEQINKSERQFNRKFTEIIGIPPLQYIKIRQLHYIINLIQLQQHNSIKELAYDTGFYDPAHFNNSFKKLTGMAPGEFIVSDKHVALDYFIDLI